MYKYITIYKGFPHSLVGEESACNAGDLGSIPESGRSPGEGNGNPLQYSCLENPMDRGAWKVIVYGVSKSQTRLSDFTCTCGPWKGQFNRTTQVLKETPCTTISLVCPLI